MTKDFKTTEKHVKELMTDILNKNKNELDMALIKPITPEYPWSTNGIYILFGRAGQGKSHDIWEHIYMSENLFDKPYYSKIIFCSTSGKLDKTTKYLSRNLKSDFTCLDDEELMPYLNKHLKRKTKYYAMVEHLFTRFKETDDEMKRLIDKHSLDDIEDRIEYIADKLAQYQWGDYPFRTLLVLDDFYGHPLIKSSSSPLVRMLTKERHYNFSCFICAQNWRGIELHVKRQATDVVLYSGFSEEDFNKTLKQIPNNLNPKRAWLMYSSMNGEHDKLMMHIRANKYLFMTEKTTIEV